MSTSTSTKMSMSSNPDDFLIETTTQDVTVGFFIIYTAQDAQERKSLLKKIHCNTLNLSRQRLQACKIVAQTLASELHNCYFAKYSPEHSGDPIVRFDSEAIRDNYIQLKGGSIPTATEIFMHMARTASQVNF